MRSKTAALFTAVALILGACGEDDSSPSDDESSGESDGGDTEAAIDADLPPDWEPMDVPDLGVRVWYLPGSDTFGSGDGSFGDIESISTTLTQFPAEDDAPDIALGYHTLAGEDYGSLDSFEDTLRSPEGQVFGSPDIETIDVGGIDALKVTLELNEALTTVTYYREVDGKIFSVMGFIKEDGPDQDTVDRDYVLPALTSLEVLDS